MDSGSSGLGCCGLVLGFRLRSRGKVYGLTRVRITAYLLKLLEADSAVSVAHSGVEDSPAPLNTPIEGCINRDLENCDILPHGMAGYLVVGFILWTLCLLKPQL